MYLTASWQGGAILKLQLLARDKKHDDGNNSFVHAHTNNLITFISVVEAF